MVKQRVFVSSDDDGRSGAFKASAASDASHCALLKRLVLPAVKAARLCKSPPHETSHMQGLRLAYAWIAQFGCLKPLRTKGIPGCFRKDC